MTRQGSVIVIMLMMSMVTAAVNQKDTATPTTRDAPLVKLTARVDSLRARVTTLEELVMPLFFPSMETLRWAMQMHPLFWRHFLSQYPARKANTPVHNGEVEKTLPARDKRASILGISLIPKVGVGVGSIRTGALTSPAGSTTVTNGDVSKLPTTWGGLIDSRAFRVTI